MNIPCLKTGMSLPAHAGRRYRWTNQTGRVVSEAPRVAVTNDGALRLTNVKLRDAGAYHCTVSQSAGGQEQTMTVDHKLIGERAVGPLLLSNLVPVGRTFCLSDQESGGAVDIYNNSENSWPVPGIYRITAMFSVYKQPKVLVKMTVAYARENCLDLLANDAKRQELTRAICPLDPCSFKVNSTCGRVLNTVRRCFSKKRH